MSVTTLVVCFEGEIAIQDDLATREWARERFMKAANASSEGQESRDDQLEQS